jgi:hypothetical protein
MRRRRGRAAGAILVSAFALLACTAFAQQKNPPASPVTAAAKPIHDPIKDVFSAADALDVEYRADIELSAIEQGKVPDAKLSEQALEHVYEAADGAEYYSQLKNASLVHFVFENNLVFAMEAFNNLDRLSIKIRAASAMAGLDKAEALRELNGIHPQFSTTSCKQPLVPDPISYYTQAGTLATQLYRTQPKGREQLDRWLDDQVGSIGSAVQLAPIGNLLAGSDLSSTELAQPLAHYLAMLAQTPATDRELQTMDDFHHIRRAMHDLVARELRDGIPAMPTVQAYRGFLIASAKEAPCADETSNWKELVEDFNALRVEAGAADAVSELALDKLDRPPSSGESAVLQVPPDDSRFAAYSQKITDLFETTHGATEWVTAGDTTGWESEVSEFLNQVDEFDPSKVQCPDCGYCQKVSWLLGTFQETPEGPYQEKVLADLVRNLATSPLQSTQRNLWLNQMIGLLNCTRVETKEQTVQFDEMQAKNRGSAITGRPVSRAMADKVRAEMRRSGNNTMYVYVEAQELFRFPYFSPYLNCKVDCH